LNLGFGICLELTGVKRSAGANAYFSIASYGGLLKRPAQRGVVAVAEI